MRYMQDMQARLEKYRSDAAECARISNLAANQGENFVKLWHVASGHPIQSLSLFHGARYADYSHGVRLIADVAYVEGAPRSIFAVLEDPQLAGVLNDEGPVASMDELVSNVIEQDSPIMFQFQPVVRDGGHGTGTLLAARETTAPLGARPDRDRPAVAGATVILSSP